MQSTASLLELFTLKRSDEDVWVGPTDGTNLPQLFGGQLVGQSIMAAGLSVEDKLVHSSHTTFLRGGRSGVPVTYRVERLRDGRSMATRVVDAWQGERLLCRTTVSCTEDVPGLSHRRGAPTAPAPSACRDLLDVAAEAGGLGEYWDDFSSIEVRLAPDSNQPVPYAAAPPNWVWMRCVEPLPDDPLVQRAALAYASDLMLMSTAVTPHGHVTGHERALAERWNAVSLDHSLWFSSETRADEWMLFEHWTPMGHGGRALIEASAFGQSGQPMAHVAQEALVRPN